MPTPLTLGIHYFGILIPQELNANPRNTVEVHPQEVYRNTPHTKTEPRMVTCVSGLVQLLSHA